MVLHLELLLADFGELLIASLKAILQLAYLVMAKFKTLLQRVNLSLLRMRLFILLFCRAFYTCLPL